MALYTFYPFKENGASETFVCFDLADDEEAHVRALDLLGQYLSAAQIVIWAGERRVATRRRGHPALQLVPNAPSSHLGGSSAGRG